MVKQIQEGSDKIMSEANLGFGISLKVTGDLPAKIHLDNALTNGTIVSHPCGSFPVINATALAENTVTYTKKQRDCFHQRINYVKFLF